MNKIINKLINVFNTEDKKRLLSNFFSLSILQIINYLLPLITFPYLIRVLGIELFGTLAFVTAVITYFQIITDFGFNLTATRQVSINRDDKEKLIEIFSSVIIIKFILTLICFLILLFLIIVFEKFRNESLIYILTFGTVIGQILFPLWFFQGMEKMKYITYLNIISKTIFTIAIFIFVQEKADYLYVPLFTSIGFIFAGVLSLYFIQKEFDVTFRFQKFQTIKFYFIDGWDIFISSFFGSFYRNFNTIILGFIANDLYVGYYNIAERIIKLIQTMQSVLGNTMFPYLTKKLAHDIRYFFQITEKYKVKIFLIYFVISLIVFAVAPYIVYILYGQFQININLNLKIMSGVILFGGLNYYFGILGLVSMNYKKEFSRYIIIVGIFNIIISSLLIFILNDIGASISLLLSEVLLFSLIINKIRNIERELK